MKFYGIGVMHPYNQSGRWQGMFDNKLSIQHIRMYESNAIILHVQVFLRMNKSIVEKCRKHGD